MKKSKTSKFYKNLRFKLVVYFILSMIGFLIWYAVSNEYVVIKW